MECAPLVSVIVPTYNRPKYLALALDSVLNQTFTDFEIVISDDCSTNPAVAQTAASYIGERVVYRRNERNVGLTENLARAVAAARGTYISIINDDDTWEPTFLKELVAPLERDDRAVASFCAMSIIDADGNIDRAQTEKNQDHFRRTGLASGFYRPFIKEAAVWQAFTAQAVVARRDGADWGRIPVDVDPLTDYWFQIELALTGKGAYYIARPLMNYRSHDRVISRSLKSLIAQVLVLGRLARNPQLSPWKGELLRRQAVNMVSAGVALLLGGKRNEARALFRAALLTGAAPTRVKAAAGFLFSWFPARLDVVLLIARAVVQVVTSDTRKETLARLRVGWNKRVETRELGEP